MSAASQLQRLIHRLSTGGILRHHKYALVLLTLVAMAGLYNWREFKNFSNPEAMDAAQLARNIAGGKGYTTLFVRPLSIHLLRKTATDKFGPAPVGDMTDRGQIRGTHPDLANPPVYPLALAAVMKCHQFRYEIPGLKASGNPGGSFSIYQPDFDITMFNEALYLIAVVAVFLVAKRLFDRRVAWTSAILFLGTELFWRFSSSGLSTMLLILIFLGIVWCLVILEQADREHEISRTARIALAAIIGVLIGVGALTRYSFGWLIFPTVVFLAVFPRRRRFIFCAATAAAFLLVLTPWVIRNWNLSHTPFGTAGYALYESTPRFPEFRLQRSLNPDFGRAQLHYLLSKLTGNSRAILLDDLPRLGGNWIMAFFLTGLLVPFHNPARARLRWYLLLCLPVLIAAQALGQTHLSEESPVVNSENLLILPAPLLFIFGVSFFYTLLDQTKFPLPQLRQLAIGVFCAVNCLPLLLALGSARTNPIAYPPYYPPILQQGANWMKPGELMMSDIPWAVAWYGRRECVWLTLNAQGDFYDINDYQKHISAVYLTPETTDSRFVSQWIEAGEGSWASFVLFSISKKELPPEFPLQKSPEGFLPEQLFLTDRERWLGPATP